MDRLELTPEQSDFVREVARKHMDFCITMRTIGPKEKRSWWDGAAASCNDLLCRLGIGECVEDLAAGAWPDAEERYLDRLDPDYD